MNFGLGGLSEIALISMLVLLLFGTKEVPHIFREMARLFAKIKMYSDKIKREFDEAIKLEEPKIPYESQSGKKKKEMRLRYRAARAGLTTQQRIEKSNEAWKHLVETPQYKDARAIMVYASTGSEVETQTHILEMLAHGKRIILPYCKNNVNELGIGEIKDLENDVAPGAFGITEPVEDKRGNFFKSDLQLIVCPGVAFDGYGGRLGNGKGYYDSFLKEIKGRVPLFGIGFDCQIYSENIPFDYHDVSMDQVITESGLLLKKEDGIA
jgi:5,10-methenyltetrahydrofolate synthetase